MPPVLDPYGVSHLARGDLREVSYDYKYPEIDGVELNLKPGSVLHEKIVREVMGRARDSYSCMQNRHASWNAIDETLTAYVSLSDAETVTKEKDARKPVSVVIPMSFAVLDALLSYMVTTYLGEETLFRFNPVAPEDAIPALMLEKAIVQQCWRSKVGLSLYYKWRDSIAYGIGITSPVWYTEMGRRTVKTPTGFNNFMGDFVQTGEERKQEAYLRFEGNRLDNIDPYCYLPDPSVAAHKVQSGEFVGWLMHDNFVTLLEREDSELGYFNVRYCKHVSGASALVSNDQSKRDKYGVRPSVSNSSLRPVDVVYMHIKLIPKEWGLGKGEKPEKWLFGVAADQVVIMADHVNANHDMLPVAVSAPDSDGYSVSPISRLEILSGMQTTIDWFISSHLMNVRKAINDILIVDPSIINMADLANPEPGKLVRTRRPVWGKGVDTAVKQLNVNDVTRQHVVDASTIIDIMQKVGAAPDTLQGIMRSGGERRSATESRGARESAFGRVEKMVLLANMQAMIDLGFMIASNTQQYMSQDTWVKVSGEWPATLLAEIGEQDMLQVTQDRINIPFDVRINDGAPSGGEYSDVWMQLYQAAISNPQAANEIDTLRLFMHVARMLGAKNIQDFKRKGAPMVNPSVQPDEQVAQQVQAGNMIPLEQAAMMGG